MTWEINEEDGSELTSVEFSEDTIYILPEKGEWEVEEL